MAGIQFFKTIIEMLPDPVFAIDKAGRVILWNSAMERLTKVKKEHIIGKDDYAHALIFYGYKRPTLAELVLKPDEKAEKKYYTKFLRYADGSVEAETYSEKMDYYDWGKAVPVLDSQGEVEAVVSVSRDVSDIRRFQREQNNLLKRYEILFSNSPDGIVCFDNNHLVLDVNDSFLKIFDYKKEECLGQDLDDLIMPKELKSIAHKRTKNLFKKGLVDFEDTRYTSKGRPIIVNVKAILMDIDDKVMGGYGIYVDVTDKAKYKKDLESMNLELEAAVEQLTSSEEELKAQFDEIQEYSKMNDELMQKYEIAIESTGSFIWEMNLNNETMQFSKNFIELVGLKAVSNKSIYEIIKRVIHEEDRDSVINELLDCIDRPNCEIDKEVRVIDRDGNSSWYLIRGKGIKNRYGEVDTLHGVLIGIEEIKIREKHIEFLANHDSLTKLYNRRKFTEIIGCELEEHKKGAMMLLDIDDFKDINDAYGHTYGDKILQYASRRLKSLAPKESLVFRFGGDEFVILIKEKDLHILKDHIVKIKDGFSDRIRIDNIDVKLTITIGIVRYPEDGDSIDELLVKADIAMYKAKESGKDMFLVFQEDMTKEKDFINKLR